MFQLNETLMEFFSCQEPLFMLFTVTENFANSKKRSCIGKVDLYPQWG